MISELWSQPASSMASTSGLLTSKSPPKQFVWSTPHRPLKRSQSSSNIAEGSPCIYERRVKRQHWASMGSSLGPKPLNSLNSRSESTTTSSSGNLTQGLQKLTNLLGTLQSDSVSVKSPALVRSKTNQPVSSFVKVPTVELIGSIAESPFRKPYARSFSSMDVRTAEAMNFPIAPDFPNFSEVQAGKSSTVQSSDNMPVTHTSHEKSNMSLSFTGAEATASFVVGDNINNNLTEDFAIDDDDDEFGAFDDDIALLNACNAAEDQYNATQANIATNQIPDPVALPKTESKDLEFDEFDYSDFDEHVLNAMDMDVLDHGGLQAAAAAAVPVIEKRVVSCGMICIFKLEVSFEIISIQKFTRWVVLEIRYEQCQMGGYFLPEKVVLLLNEANGEELIAKLRDDWYYTDIETGNYVHIIIDAGAPINPVIINNECNFVIVNPDTLISATHVADSFECLRKSVFQDMCRVSNDSNAAMVYGKLLHEIFQSCVLKRDFSVSTIEFEVEGMIRRSLEDLWSIGETELTARTHLLELVPNLQDWDMKYGRGQPIGPLDVFRTESKDKTTACVSNVLDIEEHIWSPTWGIKGNIDASLEIKTQTGRGPVVTHIMPFELKTGKSTTAVSHRAQASLYTLMMQDRYDVNVFGSILYYLKKKEMIKIPYIRDEVRGLLINRNKLASAISSRKLPPMIQNTRSCTNCYSLKTCLVYHKAVEDGDKDTAGLGSLFEENTKDFMPNHTAFFKKWESLLTKEEGDIQTSRKEVWTLGSEEREKTGSCLSGMTVVGEEDFSQDAAKVHRFTYTMKKATSVVSLISGAAASSSFLNLQLAAGDPIVISSEKGHYALAIGFLTQVDVDSVTVTVDRRLKGLPKRLRNFDIESNQVYSGIRMNSEGFIVSDSINLTDAAPAVYRIDKDEFSAGMALVRGNLTNLFIPDGDVKRRRLVVDLEPPTFRSSQPEDLALIESDPNLNIDQKNAMQKVLNANDYSLILGMPGTGKTTTIAQIIKALVSRGKSVLLTAYTHSAVDNVLLKLKSECVDFIRLGGHQRVHPDLHEFTAKIFESVEDVRRFYEQKQVVATTCLGIKQESLTIVSSMKLLNSLCLFALDRFDLPMCLF
ncbi:DNA replication factor Dna2-domain-containing protein [Obelidium mucronatum]|nr:DNA replication factor Dna2-domain-containing protein [Obelidium mucronatum]